MSQTWGERREICLTKLSMLGNLRKTGKSKILVILCWLVCNDPFSVSFSVHSIIFSAANLALAGFPLTNVLGESMPSRHWKMFNLRLCNAATIRYSQLKFGHVHLCGMDYEDFSAHCCKCNSFGCTAAIRCDNACRGPHSDSLYSGSEHSQFNSPRLVKREAGFPNPRRVLIGSNQLWRVNDSPYYRELEWPRVCHSFSFFFGRNYFFGIE